MHSLESQGFTSPTVIQAQAIPPLMSGKDLIGLAQTGSGKTAAFLLPLLNHLNKNQQKRLAGRPRSLILAPTRELAQQIGLAIRTLGGRAAIKSAMIYGGVSYQQQFKALKGGLDILVATPGRLMDHLERGSVSFDRAETLILDEADRMLDMGFVHDVNKIAALMPEPHQTVLFSATMSKQVKKLTADLLTDPVEINVAPKLAVSDTVAHSVMHLPADKKKDLLKEVLADPSVKQAIIFTKTKFGADKLSKILVKQGLKSDAIHGNRNQNQRQRSLDKFRAGKTRILVATDVAARGIDVPGIGHVINFDLPREPEAYVHRVGRTGRNEAKGKAISFCAPEDIGLLRAIEKLLKEPVQVDESHAYHTEPAKKARPKNARRARNKRKPSNKGPRKPSQRSRKAA